MFVYIYKDTGYFYAIAQSPLDRTDLIEVTSLPPDSEHKWNGNFWEPLTESEITAIEESDPDYNKDGIVEKGILTPNTTEVRQLCYFNNSDGSEINNSTATTNGAGDLSGRYINAASFFLNNVLLTLSSFLAGAVNNECIPYYQNGEWRSRLLSEVSKKQWTFSASINKKNVNDDFLCREGETPTDLSPFAVPFESVCHTIVVSCRPSEFDEFNVYLYRGGAIIASANKPRYKTKAVYSDLRIDCQAGDAIAIRIKAVSDKEKIDYPAVSLLFIEK